MDKQLARWRTDTPGCTQHIHLDNAGSALMPRSVLDSVVGHLHREAILGGYESADAAADTVLDSYRNLAELIGAAPRNMAIVENATVGFFQALSAFDFSPGDVLVTTRNDYVSHQIAYLSLAKRRGVRILRAADHPSGGVDPQSVRELLRHPRVRVLTAAWVPTNSGLIQPVEILGDIAEAAGVPYLVDACQAIGQLPVDVSRLRCDFLAATGRKFLRGPRGIGFLYVSDRALQRGDYPLYIDMRGADWVTADSYQLQPDARRFENWEFAYALVLGIGEAARYALEVDVAQASRRALSLATLLRRELSHIVGLRVLDRGSELAAIVTVDMAAIPAPELATLLRQRGINTSATFREYAVIDMDEKHAASALRISPHYYNTEEEIHVLIKALAELSGATRTS